MFIHIILGLPFLVQVHTEEIQQKAQMHLLQLVCDTYQVRVLTEKQ